MRILFAGGDARMKYAAEKLSGAHDITRFGEEYNGTFDAVVLPLPLTKDGETIFSPQGDKSPLTTFEALFEEVGEAADEHTLVLAGGEAPALTELCGKRGFGLVNYFARETLTLRNAALTAEAALCILSQSGDGALLGSEALIAGGGRIAVFLAERLRACGCAVTLAARDPNKRELLRLNGYNAVPLEELHEILPRFDCIANTIPAPIFDERLFSQMRADAVYTELATLSEEPRRTFAQRRGVKYIFAGGLPGKCSPKAAGGFIADELEAVIASREAGRRLGSCKSQ